MRAFLVIRPAEPRVDYLDIAKQVCDDLVVGSALDAGKERRASAVHQLLQSRDLKIKIDLLVGLDHIAPGAQPSERAARILDATCR